MNESTKPNVAAQKHVDRLGETPYGQPIVKIRQEDREEVRIEHASPEYQRKEGD